MKSAIDIEVKYTVRVVVNHKWTPNDYIRENIDKLTEKAKEIIKSDGPEIVSCRVTAHEDIVNWGKKEEATTPDL